MAGPQRTCRNLPEWQRLQTSALLLSALAQRSHLRFGKCDKPKAEAARPTSALPATPPHSPKGSPDAGGAAGKTLWCLYPQGGRATHLEPPLGGPPQAGAVVGTGRGTCPAGAERVSADARGFLPSGEGFLERQEAKLATGSPKPEALTGVPNRNLPECGEACGVTAPVSYQHSGRTDTGPLICPALSAILTSLRGAAGQRLWCCVQCQRDPATAQSAQRLSSLPGHPRRPSDYLITTQQGPTAGSLCQGWRVAPVYWSQKPPPARSWPPRSTKMGPSCCCTRREALCRPSEAPPLPHLDAAVTDVLLLIVLLLQVPGLPCPSAHRAPKGSPPRNQRSATQPPRPLQGVAAGSLAESGCSLKPHWGPRSRGARGS